VIIASDIRLGGETKFPSDYVPGFPLFLWSNWTSTPHSNSCPHVHDHSGSTRSLRVLFSGVPRSNLNLIFGDSLCFEWISLLFLRRCFGDPKIRISGALIPSLYPFFGRDINSRFVFSNRITSLPHLSGTQRQSGLN